MENNLDNLVKNIALHNMLCEAITLFGPSWNAILRFKLLRPLLNK